MNLNGVTEGLIISSPGGADNLHPVPTPPIMALEALPSDWWMEVLDTARMADPTTPDGMQAMALQQFQMVTALRVLFDRVKALEEKNVGDSNRSSF